MTDTRTCEQCGTAFVPRREHARFCSARCRVAWNREIPSHQAAEMSPLDWAVTAMQDAIGQLSSVQVRDSEGVLAVISEAVWRVTIVDATLVRYYPAAYDNALRCRASAERRPIEDTLAGLRFVRNQMGHYADRVDFICSEPSRGRQRRHHRLDMGVSSGADADAASASRAGVGEDAVSGL